MKKLLFVLGGFIGGFVGALMLDYVWRPKFGGGCMIGGNCCKPESGCCKPGDNCCNEESECCNEQASDEKLETKTVKGKKLKVSKKNV